MIATLILTAVLIGVPVLLVGIAAWCDADQDGTPLALICFGMLACLIVSGISLYQNRFKPLVEPPTVEMKV